MKRLSESLTFTTPLSATAHRLAQQFRRRHKYPQKGKQVYLNTLAVSAVEFYLRCMGVKTNWEMSQSRNPAMQSLLNVADLDIPNRGKLECLPVLPDASVVRIPPEVWFDRIGYVAVQLDATLQQATLLGFTPTSGEAIPLNQLRPLDDLLTHLQRIKPLEAAKPRVNLSQWFENLFEAGWRSLETLTVPSQTMLVPHFRNVPQISETAVRRAKLIDLGVQLGHQSVALLVAITPSAEGGNAVETEANVEIIIQVHPVDGELYLPPDLRMSLLAASGETLQAVKSRHQDNYIQLKRFRGVPGECFDINVALDDTGVTEAFVI